MILAVDAGNTRVKWALHDGRDFVSDGWVTHAQIDMLDAQWAVLPAPSSIVIGNVAGEAIGQKL
ncbi:MAG: type III pantothenate kinase, partial [Betaproteobacteria bacterium]